MSFDERDLRRGLDVFSQDGVYLGSVVWVRCRREAVAVPETTAWPIPVAVPGDTTAFSGETLGPMPTAHIGNAGPRRQSAGTGYASRATVSPPGLASRPSELVLLRMMVSLDWSSLAPRVRRIPVDLVQVVSLERIILSVPASDLP